MPFNFFLIFFFCCRLATVSSFIFYSGKAFQKAVQAINSSNCFLYLGIQTSVLLSDPIRRGLIVIHAQFKY